MSNRVAFLLGYKNIPSSLLARLNKFHYIYSDNPSLCEIYSFVKPIPNNSNSTREFIWSIAYDYIDKISHLLPDSLFQNFLNDYLSHSVFPLFDDFYRIKSLIKNQDLISFFLLTLQLLLFHQSFMVLRVQKILFHFPLLTTPIFFCCYVRGM